MRVESFLTDSARRYPDKAALVEGGRRVSYAELDEKAGRLANVLRRAGVGRGDPVVVIADPSALTVAAIFASLRAGAVFSPINPSTKADKLTYVLNNCRAKAVVTPAGLLPVVAEAVGRVPTVVTTLVDGLPAGSPEGGSASGRRWRPPRRTSPPTAGLTSTWRC